MAVSKWFKRGGILAAVTVLALSFASCGAIDGLFGAEDGPVSVTGVSLDYSTRIMRIGDTKALVATVVPSNADDKSLTWTSSDDSIVSVDSGTITCNALGSATITATTVDGAKVATCDVTVANIAIAGIWDGGSDNYLLIDDSAFTVDNPADWAWDYSGEVVSYSNSGFNASETGEGDCGYAVIKFTSHPSGAAVEGKYTVLRWKNLTTSSGITTVETCEGYLDSNGDWVADYFDSAEAAVAGATAAAGYFDSYSSSTKQ